ncbi:ABC-three component system middle component 7 [Anaerococcus vaginalis]|uniref:ABC-three component system middle component 7 n=1 Tax=Anaerococcus vaginalis TaxID=33037 RepID=UPI003744703C
MHLKKKDMTPSDVYKKVKNRVSCIQEFIEILDSLHALNKIELQGEVLHYVD